MSCDGIQALNPLCQAEQALNSQATGMVDSAFSHIAGYFGLAASDATGWLWRQIDAATTLDLHSPQLLREMAVTGAIAAVLCLGLFLVQVITATLRREPGGLSRALTGLVVSFIGSAVALGATRALLGAVDALSDGVVQYTLGTNIAGLGDKLAFAKLATVSNPAATLLFAVVILASVVIVWAAMMIRKLVLLIAAVLAPLAFAGATADITRAWVRRWIEFVAAMVVSKLLLVIILSIGITVLNGAGQNGNSPTQAGTQLAGGALILLMGGLAPWVAIRMFSFAGDALTAAHATAGQAASGARSMVAAPQKASYLQWQARTLMPTGHRSSSGGGMPPPRSAAGHFGTPRPTTATGNAGAAQVGGRGAGGAAVSSGGAAAASAAAAPAIAAVSAAQTGKAVVDKGITTLSSTQPGRGGDRPEPPAPQPPKRA